MQGIDFKPVLQKGKKQSKYTHHYERLSDFAHAREVEHKNGKKPSISLYVSIGIICFTFGFVAGVKWYSVKLTKQFEKSALNQITTNNVNPSSMLPQNDKEETQKEEDRKDPVAQPKQDLTQYIILAKIYRDRLKAEKYGYVLKKAGLPVFLAESGKKMKVYVGPLTGKQEAYKMLAKVKKIPEFKAAILYKR